MNVFRFRFHSKGFFLVSLFLVFALFPAVAGYTIDSFDSHIEVSETGVYEVTEKARLTFDTPMHGFYRNIPTGYLLQDGSELFARLSKVRANEQLQVSSSRYETVIRLGSPDRTVTGPKEYSIQYRFDLGEDRYQDRDEFYFNLIGTEWDQPIRSSSFSITFPFPVSADRIEVLRGMYGSVSSAGVRYSLSEDRRVLSGEALGLVEGEAVTVRVVMEEGYYAKRPNYTFLLLPFLAALMTLSLFLAYRWWHTYGRDTPPVIVPRYTPVDGMSPLDAGYLIDRNVDAHDLTSMIFYWADRGHLSIIEEKKKFTFVRGVPLTGASGHEQDLFTSFFALGTSGVVTEKDLKNSFYKVFQEVSKKVARFYSKERALVSEESKRRVRYILLLSLADILLLSLTLTVNYIGMYTLILSACYLAYVVLNTIILYRVDDLWFKSSKLILILLIALLLLFSLFVLLAGYLLSYLSDSDFSSALYIVPLSQAVLFVLSFFAVVTRQRSAYGQRKLEEVLGLKDFIETVEMDELKQMIDRDPEFYYRLLSYAIVLGLEKKWAKKFSSFTIESPPWYSGHHPLVGTMMVSSMIRSCDHALVTNIAPPKSTSTGGGHFSGGGGFSGGGFGGGGGGGW